MEKENKSSRNRHAPEKVSRLEEIFKEIKRPKEHQRHEIGKELGLEPMQVKYWFQNKRTQIKTLNEKEVKHALRVDNEKMLSENILLKEALKNKFCPTCEGPPQTNHVEHEHSMKQLQLENALMKEEREKVSKFLAMYTDKPKPIEPCLLQLVPPITSSNESALLNLGVGSSSTNPSALDENVLPKPTRKLSGMEKAIMLEVGKAAKEELLELLCTNEPLWVKSQADRRLVLHVEHYDKVFPRVNHFNGAKARVESSKDSRIVRIKAAQLVDMLLDSEKWNDLFSTIVTKAQTIGVLDRGSSENRSGALLLMYEEMHVLSPLLPSREFYFLRYCEQVELGIWVIVDVSYDYLKEDKPHSYTWKFPSGCMIHQISSGSSQVSWVEHVEIEDNIQTHYLYTDLVNNAIAFGAERWLMELQRMSERFASAATEYIPAAYDSGVVILPKGRRSLMQLSHRMVKSFCRTLTMSSKMDNIVAQYMIGDDDNSGVMISIQTSTDPHPNDMTIVVVSSSFSLPLPSQTLFDFFRDPEKRFQWDVLCCGNPWHEVAHIVTGTHPNNYISIIQPMDPPPLNSVVIIQESFIDPLGSFVVYSPVNIPELKIVINGQDSSTVLVLPSGIVISEENQAFSYAQTSSSSSENGGKKTRGSLLTVAFQILMPSPAAVNLESVVVVRSLMTSTIESIKNAFAQKF